MGHARRDNDLPARQSKRMRCSPRCGLYVAEDQWPDAVNMADQLLKRSFSKAVLRAGAKSLISRLSASNKQAGKTKRSRLT